MPERERNAAEGKEKMTDEDKHAQKEKTINRKENACGFRNHLILQQKNSIDAYRPKCKKVRVISDFNTNICT